MGLWRKVVVAGVVAVRVARRRWDLRRSASRAAMDFLSEREKAFRGLLGFLLSF